MVDNETEVSCPLTRPICLKRPHGKNKIMEKNCDASAPEDYIPHDRIMELLAYERNRVPDIRNIMSNSEEHCYAFDTAWLTVITDVMHRIQALNPKSKLAGAEKIQPSKEEDEEARAKIKEAFTSKKMDLVALFTSINEVAKQKWNYDTNTEKCSSPMASDESNAIATQIIEGLDRLITSDIFILFSQGEQIEAGEAEEDKVEAGEEEEEAAGEEEAAAGEEEEDEEEATAAIVPKALDDETKIDHLVDSTVTSSLTNLEKLFEYVKVIMNPAADLSNAIRGNNIEQEFNTIIGMFQVKQTGGGFWGELSGAINMVRFYAFGIPYLALLILMNIPLINKLIILRKELKYLFKCVLLPENLTDNYRTPCPERLSSIGKSWKELFKMSCHQVIPAIALALAHHLRLQTTVIPFLLLLLQKCIIHPKEYFHIK